MTHCSECGKELALSSDKCPDCGTPIDTGDILVWAAESGDVVRIREIIEAGADVDARNQYSGATALIIAAAWCTSEKASREVAALLLDHGAQVNARTDDQQTALICASGEGRANLVDFLLERGADIESIDEKGYTALLMAAEKGYSKAIAILLDRGADLSARNKDGSDSLILASRGGHVEAAGILLDKGADVNLSDSGGWTALM